MLGTGFDDEGGGADETMEAGAFPESDGTGTGDLATDLTFDSGGGGSDGIEEFDACALGDAEVAAMDDADDFSMSADEEITRAMDGTGQFTERREMVATQRGSSDRTGFLDHHIAAGLDPAIPWLGDLVIEQTDVAATLRTLAGLRFANRGEGMVAIEANDLPRGFHGVKQAHQKRPGGRGGWAETAYNRRLRRQWRGFRIGVVAGGCQTCHRQFSHHAFAVPHLKVRQTSTALCGNHECGFELLLSAFRACHLNAMALGLIGHD